ncbi:MAG: ParA family protein [Bryobacteraceae bacterium]|nr:ParA family protein [Bryobacteraceae bacterium]
MSIPVIAFFNNKGGVGKTTLVYHTAWMYADLGLKVLAADLDPQANLTSAFVEEERLEQLWPEEGARLSISGCLEPLVRGTSDVGEVHVEEVEESGSKVWIVPGDLLLSSFEAHLSEAWPRCVDGDERAFRVTSSIYRALQRAAERCQAELVLMDLGPNLGAINRACLVSSDSVVIPLAPDLFSLQGLRNLGPTLAEWRKQWARRMEQKPARLDFPLPQGEVRPAGYVILMHSVRLDRPVKSFEKWMRRIPEEYHRSILNDTLAPPGEPHSDPECLYMLKHFRSLVPMAQEARKPIFHLRAADGAIGSHAQLVQEARREFQRLAGRILEKTGLGWLFTSRASR